MRASRTALVVVLALCACGTTTESTTVETRVVTQGAAVGEQDERNTRKILLTTGDRLSVSVDAEGGVEIQATIVGGKRDAGTYTSTEASMFETANAAKNALGEPNTQVSITVDESDEIVAISYQVTLQ